MARHNELGKAGEEKAVAYLLQRGYIILDRNWRWRRRELDIVCVQGDLLVIVEVKTRTSPEETLEDILNFQKRKFLRQAADAYIKAKDLTKEVRFDLIFIKGEKMEIEHVQEAMQVFE